jgi:hypothetical protein
MLLLQWAYDPSRFDAEVEALAAGPLKEMTQHRESFGGVPQLFVDLDEPNPVVRAQVQDLVSGAHVGYCMTQGDQHAERIGHAPARADHQGRSGTVPSLEAPCLNRHFLTPKNYSRKFSIMPI